MTTWNLLKAHIHRAQTCLIGYIHTHEVPTLHNGGVLIRSNLLTKIGKDTQGNDHEETTHWWSSMMDHD
jgi:hypothetical protein